MGDFVHIDKKGCSFMTSKQDGGHLIIVAGLGTGASVEFDREALVKFVVWATDGLNGDDSE
jgi:hypothetical protein